MIVVVVVGSIHLRAARTWNLEREESKQTASRDARLESGRVVVVVGSRLLQLIVLLPNDRVAVAGELTGAH